jgi:hypothetical protein
MSFNLATILTETTLAEPPKGPSGKILKTALRHA